MYNNNTMALASELGSIELKGLSPLPSLRNSISVAHDLIAVLCGNRTVALFTMSPEKIREDNGFLPHLQPTASGYTASHQCIKELERLTYSTQPKAVAIGAHRQVLVVTAGLECIVHTILPVPSGLSTFHDVSQRLKLCYTAEDVAISDCPHMCLGRSAVLGIAGPAGVSVFSSDGANEFSECPSVKELDGIATGALDISSCGRYMAAVATNGLLFAGTFDVATQTFVNRNPNSRGGLIDLVPLNQIKIRVTGVRFNSTASRIVVCWWNGAVSVVARVGGGDGWRRVHNVEPSVMDQNMPCVGTWAASCGAVKQTILNHNNNNNNNTTTNNNKNTNINNNRHSNNNANDSNNASTNNNKSNANVNNNRHTRLRIHNNRNQSHPNSNSDSIITLHNPNDTNYSNNDTVNNNNKNTNNNNSNNNINNYHATKNGHDNDDSDDGMGLMWITRSKDSQATSELMLMTRDQHPSVFTPVIHLQEFPTGVIYGIGLGSHGCCTLVKTEHAETDPKPTSNDSEISDGVVEETQAHLSSWCLSLWQAEQTHGGHRALVEGEEGASPKAAVVVSSRHSTIKLFFSASNNSNNKDNNINSINASHNISNDINNGINTNSVTNTNRISNDYTNNNTNINTNNNFNTTNDGSDEDEDVVYMTWDGDGGDDTWSEKVDLSFLSKEALGFSEYEHSTTTSKPRFSCTRHAVVIAFSEIIYVLVHQLLTTPIPTPTSTSSSSSPTTTTSTTSTLSSSSSSSSSPMSSSSSSLRSTKLKVSTPPFTSSSTSRASYAKKLSTPTMAKNTLQSSSPTPVSWPLPSTPTPTSTLPSTPPSTSSSPSTTTTLTSPPTSTSTSTSTSIPVSAVSTTPPPMSTSTSTSTSPPPPTSTSTSQSTRTTHPNVSRWSAIIPTSLCCIAGVRGNLIFALSSDGILKLWKCGRRNQLDCLGTVALGDFGLDASRDIAVPDVDCVDELAVLNDAARTTLFRCQVKEDKIVCTTHKIPSPKLNISKIHYFGETHKMLIFCEGDDITTSDRKHLQIWAHMMDVATGSSTSMAITFALQTPPPSNDLTLATIVDANLSILNHFCPDITKPIDI